MYTYRLQVESANRIARQFAEATADELVSDINRHIATAEALFGDLLDDGWSPGWISDAVGQFMDDAIDKLGRINADLDAERAEPRSLDLDDLRALLTRANQKWEASRKHNGVLPVPPQKGAA